jgi:hypothetical protein
LENFPSPIESGDEDYEEKLPTAPPLERLMSVQGYEQASYQQAIRSPPAFIQPQINNPPDRQELTKYRPLTEKQARDAILDFTFTSQYYSKMAARHMNIKDIIPSNAYHYRLETFSEKRETAWKFEPYDGGPIDSQSNGPAPDPWSIVAYSPPFFEEGQVSLSVPHTSCVTACHMCNATGRTQCVKCNGQGKVACTSCTPGTFCQYCRNTNQRSCYKCEGVCTLKCKTCKGRGQLKCFIELTISWVNHVDEYVYNRTDLPDDLVKKVSGEEAVHEEMPKVWPILNFIENSVNSASQSLVEKHDMITATEKIIRQRHVIRIVPVGQVFYKWKHTSRCFYVYGAVDRRVYAPGYPQRCCIL